MSAAADLSKLSPERRRLIELLLEEEGLAAASIPRRRDPARGIVSFAQQRLWFLDQLDPGSPQYNLPTILRLTGDLDLRAIERALDELARRHEALRTVFEVDGVEPSQVIAPSVHIPVEYRDLSDLPHRDRERTALDAARERACAPFDLQRGPLLRVHLWRTAEREHLVLLTMHHIVSDGWSAGILTRELGALYTACAAGEPCPLPELPVQYADYAEWQRDRLQGSLLASELSYWKSQIEGAPALDLPTDRPRPASLSHRGASHPFLLPAGATVLLRDLAQEETASLFMLLLAAFEVLLFRYSGQTDFCVGTPISGRNRAELEGLIGFFVNTLPLRARLSGDLSFRDVLRRTRGTVLAAFTHQDLPFDVLVSELHPERSLSRAPVFQTLFALQNNASPGAIELPGLEIAPLEIDTDTAVFDLALTLSEHRDELLGWIRYSTDLFDTRTIRRMGTHFRSLIEAIAEDPDRPISRLPMLTRDERSRVLFEWNSQRISFEETTVHALFERQAAATPDAVAVWAAGESLTYAELNRRANQLADHLRRLGVGPDVPVGLCLERSCDLIVGLLGILKAGGAYVPLDPAYPAGRLAFILEDSRVPVLVTQTGVHRPEVSAGAAVVCLDLMETSLAAGRDANLESGAEPGNLAYIIYTSGSTGKPKGVMIEHREAVNLLHALDESVYGTHVAGPLHIALNSPLSFDASAQQVLRLLRGDALYLVPEDIRLDGTEYLRFISEHRIDSIDSVPSHLRLLIEAGMLNGAGHRPAVFFSGGEPIDERMWGNLARAETTRFINAYGPTECTVEVTLCEIRSGPEKPSIGRPIANTQCYVLDSHMEPAPIGIVGELYIGGWNVGRGYLHRPELTAEKFVPDPFAATAGARLYRTGDAARWTREGNLEFLGRLDRQVKIRGFRIELGEIEAVLDAQPGVREALVMARQDATGAMRLVAYVVPDAAGRDPEFVTRLKEAVQRSLPAYMSPAAFALLDSYPLLPSGKVDANALPNPDGAPDKKEYLKPRDELERRLAELYSEFLGVERAGLNDGFFELGGDSIKAAMLANRLQKELGIDVRVRWVFEAPTIAGLAAQLRRQHQGGLPPIEPSRREGELPLSFGQQRLWFLEQMETELPVYNIPVAIRLRGALDPSAMERSLNDVIARHEILRTGFPLVGGKPVQRISASVSVPLRVQDLSALPPEQREAEAKRLSLAGAQERFDLARAPLLRGCLLRFDEREHVLLLTVHHIIFDGWSAQLLLSEISRAYDEGAVLPALAVQYADFTHWQKRCFADGLFEAQVEYWKTSLRGVPPLLELPTDRPRGAEPNQGGAMHEFVLSAALSEKLRCFSRERGVTLFMTLLGAYAALLSRYSGQNDVCIGTPIAGRNRAELEPLIGLFVNTLALRVDAAGDPDFNALVERVRKTAVEAFANQDVPFDRVVDAVQPERNVTRSPLFQVMFALQTEQRKAASLAGMEMDILDTATGTSAFDLTLSLTDGAGPVQGAWEYSLDLFEPETVARMAAHFGQLLESAMADPSQRLSLLEMRTSAERQTLAEANVEAPAAAAFIHERIEAQAATKPDAIAVVSGGDRMTYGELNRRANQLARYLRRQGVGPDVRVAVCLDRSTDLIVTVLAVLKAGGAYVPLDASHPPERIAYMIEDSRAAVLVTNSQPPAGQQVRVIALETARDGIAVESSANLEPLAAEDDLAYMIYTSGSTGRPKGVMITRRGLSNAYPAWAEVYRLGAASSFLQMASFSFDVFTADFVRALCSGGKLVLCPREYLLDPPALYDLMLREQIDFAEFVPAVVRGLAQHVTGLGRTLNFVKVLVSGSDRLLGSDCEMLRRACGPSTLILNSYGVTEATIDNSCFDTGQAAVPPSQPAPIGRAFRGTQLYVVDRNFRLAPVGVPGELCIGGAGLARGYLDRPDLTAERFVPNPFSKAPGARLYRTGDRARYRGDSNVEFLGRLDHQVKVRGFRVEAGEIETALLQHPRVREAAVVAIPAADGNARLAAYFVPEGGTAPGIAELRGFLLQSLPDYMVPATFTELASMPRTTSGKTDRKALPAPEETRSDPEAEVPPSNEVERILAGIWQEVLGRAHVGIHDNFFELGGDSILSIQVIARANQAGLRLTPKQLFQNPTVERLAAVAGRAPVSVSEQGILEGPLPLTPIQRWFFSQQLFDPHHYNQSVLIDAAGGLRRDLLEATLRRLLEHHDALRLRFSERDGIWKQGYSGAGDDVALEWEDLGGTDPARRDEIIQERCGAVQTGLDLSAGPLLRAVYFDFGAGQGGRLMVAVHHLAVDAVSWRILLEDFQRIYEALRAGEAPQLPPKTTSYRQWAQALERYSANGKAQAQIGHWKAIWQGGVPPLPLDFAGENTESSGEEIVAALGPDETRALIEEVPAAGYAEINDVLLAALWRALSVVTGARAFVVDVEGHGREQIEESLDLSRTVGWFTSVYPVRLEAGREGWPAGALKKIKEQLRSMPDRGIGYGALRYLAANEALAQLPEPEFCFNYLGRFESASDSPAGWKETAAAPARERSPRDRRAYLIEVNGLVGGGRLQMYWSYSSAVHRRATVERLAGLYLDALRDIIAHCRTSKASVATPSEFPLAGLNQAKLDRLIARATAGKRT